MTNDLMQIYLDGKQSRKERTRYLETKLESLLNQELVRSISPYDLELLAKYRNTFTWDETFFINVECQIDVYAPSEVSIEVEDRTELMSYISGEEKPEIDVNEVLEGYSIGSDLDADCNGVEDVSDPSVSVIGGSLKLKEELDPLVIKFTNFLTGLNEKDKETFFSSYDSPDLIRIYSKLQNQYLKED